MRKHYALYGGLRLERGFCTRCKDYAIIRKGVFLCCDSPTKGECKYQKVIAQACGKRKSPSKRLQTEIIAKQDGKCLYCDIPFGTLFYDAKRKKARTLNPCWDHRMPFSYLQANPDWNWAASCAICNGIKSDKLFQTLEEARDYVRHRRAKKGITEENFSL